MEIKVLGGGCEKCETLLKETQKAVSAVKPEAVIEYVTDWDRIMDYGIMTTPALMIDGKVVSTGRVLRQADIEKLIL